MSAWLRLAWICLLAIAVPVQGAFAASIVPCGPQGHEVVRSAAPSEHSRSMEAASLHQHAAHGHPGSHAAASPHAWAPSVSDEAAQGAGIRSEGPAVDDGAAQADTSAASSCSVCAACCAGASLPAQAIVFGERPAASAPPTPQEPHAPVFLTAAPERPPRALLA